MADWYRSTEWDDQREADFIRRLMRARHKAQYLAVQAAALVATGRTDFAATALNLVALFVEDHYEPQFASSAFLTKARALLILDRWDDAVQAFEEALAARRAMPNVVDNTWLEYPLAIARRRARDRYPRALRVLDEFRSPTALVFPLEEFQYFAALALISADEGDRAGAARWARNALATTSRRAPFARHPDAGLTGPIDDDLRTELEQLAGS